MSYTSRHRYKTMREKNRRTWRNAKVAVVVALLFGLVYLIMNRVRIMDHLGTYLM